MWLNGHRHRIDIAELHLQHLDRLFASGEGNEETASMLDDVRVVDVAPSDEVEHLGEDDPIGTDGERERIALLWIGIGDEDLAAIG